MKFHNLVLGLIALLALGIILLAFSSADYSSLGSGLGGSKCVGVVPLEGEIVSEKGFAAGQISSADVVAAVEEANGNAEVSALLLEINSGGGSAVASKEIYDALAESEKPVVAYIGEIGASGAYYAASATDYVVANPNSITGSIGARATILNYEELFNKLGLRQENIKTGELKDIGEGYRNLTGKERGLLQALLNETFENFRDDVKKGREGKLNNGLFNELLDARVLSAKQSLKAGLVDEIGSRKKALEKAAGLGKIKFEHAAEIRECELIQRNSLLDVLSSLSASFGRSVAYHLRASSAGVQYK